MPHFPHILTSEKSLGDQILGSRRWSAGKVLLSGGLLFGFRPNFRPEIFSQRRQDFASSKGESKVQAMIGLRTAGDSKQTGKSFVPAMTLPGADE